MPTIASTPQTNPFLASKQASDSAKIADSGKAIKPETPQVVKALQKDSVEVSKFITIPGSALTSGVIGAGTGAVMAGAIDIATKSGAMKEALSAGSVLGGASGVVAGAVIAHMAPNKTQATLYSALAGFGTGAVIGGTKIGSWQAAVGSGIIGAVSGAVSGFATSKLLGK